MAEIKNTKKAIKDSNKIIKYIDDLADKIKAKFEKIKDGAIGKTIDLNQSKPPFTASSLVAVSIDNDLKKIINNTEEGFDSFIKASEKYLSNNFSINLSKIDLKAISKKKSVILDSLVDNTKILKTDIQDLLTQNLAKGIPQKTLIKELKDIYPAYSRNASTLLNTGMSRLFIDSNVSKFKSSRFNWYLYAGPDDAITRDIPCKKWVWHRFPASQLDIIRASRMKLWNCRHNIIPLSDEEKDNYPLLVI